MPVLARSARVTRREDLSTWLASAFRFDLFVTLTTHTPGLRRTRLRGLVKEWDARMNRALYGPKWHAHPDQLLWMFAFCEKPEVNPHWHLLVRGGEPDAASWADQLIRFPELATDTWQRLIPSGTADVRRVATTQDRLADYAVKELGGQVQYDDYITPDEFRRF